MADEQLIMSLAKVLIAAAWADGELTEDEVNSVKDLLFHIPELTANQWASLAIYAESPVDDAERARLVEDLRHAIRSNKDKQLATRALDELLAADGQVTAEEDEAAADIRAVIESADVGPLAGLMRVLTSNRSRALADAPNREDFIEDYINNKVYYGIQRRLNMGEVELDLPEESLRKLSLAGGIMAQIAQVNPQVTDGEVSAIVGALETYWHLASEQAAFVAGVAVSETASLLDPFRLSWEFANACTAEERAGFLDVLFAVAAADGNASFDEIEEIRIIAKSLKLTHKQFIEAKLRIPADQREP